MIIWKIPGIFLLVIKLIIIKKGGFWMDLDRLLVHDVMMAMINPTFQARSIVFKSVCGGGRLIRILLTSKNKMGNSKIMKILVRWGGEGGAQYL